MKNKYKFHSVIARIGFLAIFVPYWLRRLDVLQGQKGYITSSIIGTIIGIILLINILAANKAATENDKKYPKYVVITVIFYIIATPLLTWLNIVYLTP